MIIINAKRQGGGSSSGGEYFCSRVRRAAVRIRMCRWKKGALRQLRPGTDGIAFKLSRLTRLAMLLFCGYHTYHTYTHTYTHVYIYRYDVLGPKKNVLFRGLNLIFCIGAKRKKVSFLGCRPNRETKKHARMRPKIHRAIIQIIA